MLYDENLDNVKPGDKVYWDGGYNGKGILTVSKVTATQVVIKRKYRGNEEEYESRYNKKNGWLIGRNRYTTDLIAPLTPERLEHLKVLSLKKRAQELRDKLSIPQTRDELEKFVAALEPLVNTATQPA